MPKQMIEIPMILQTVMFSPNNSQEANAIKTKLRLKIGYA